MQIGFDISAQCLPRSGIGRYQYQLLKALLKIDQRHFYHLYAFNLRSRRRFEELRFSPEPKGAPGSGENYKIQVTPIPQRLITLWWMMMRTPTLEQFNLKCDIVHLSEICVQPVRRAKTVAFIHDLTTLLYPGYHLKSNVFLHSRRFKGMDRVDAILTNSESTKRDIVEHLKIKPDKIFVTYLGADDHFRPMDKMSVESVLKKYNLTGSHFTGSLDHEITGSRAPNCSPWSPATHGVLRTTDPVIKCSSDQVLQCFKPYILFVGTLEPRKNVETLIKAFNRLKKNKHIPHQLVLVGQKGWLYQNILKAIEASPYQQDIRQMDYIADQDLPALMNGADVFVYPSFYEGFGLPILEAMQCGIPVITSNISSLPEVGGEACLYADPHSSEALANQIYSVINDSELQKTLSKKGIERAKRFSWEKCARATLSVYEHLAGQ